MIDKNVFFNQFKRLEKQFNQGREMDTSVREEYYKALKYFHPKIFENAMDEVIKTHRPYTGHVFPSISMILDIIDDLGKLPNYGLGESEQIPPEDICQRCNNIGFYLGLGETEAKFCQCKYGAKKRAVWKSIGLSKKDTRVIWESEKSNEPPVKGIKEWNPLGFWEDTQEEHDRWMAMKRAQIEEMDRRRPRPSKSVNEREWESVVKNTIGKFAEEKQDDGIDF